MLPMSDEIEKTNFATFSLGICTPQIHYFRGIYNCVHIPALDRYVHHRSTRSESPALDVQIVTTGLADARVLREHAEGNASDDFVNLFTHW